MILAQIHNPPSLDIYMLKCEYTVDFNMQLGNFVQKTSLTGELKLKFVV